jgi:transcriptional regulator with XRE-family HTH domain
MQDEQRRRDLADFLRTRRERLVPEEVGMPGGTRRRTPGLRREEVAQLANVGVSWYTLLEQGRDIHPSAEILHGIATALHLTPEERDHLFLLANPQRLADVSPPEEYISPELRRLLEDLDPDPAYVMGWRWNYLAWNKAAKALFAIWERPTMYPNNIIWKIFVHDRQPDDPRWQAKAQHMLAEFRAESAPYLGEPWLKQLIADLQATSAEFREWWQRHDVRGRLDGSKYLHHELVGNLAFDHVTLQVPSNPGLKVVILMPLADTDTAAKLRHLMDATQDREGALEPSAISQTP